MRGHKLTLVWLEYKIGTLSKIRSTSVGTERAGDHDRNAVIKRVLTRTRDYQGTPKAQQRMVDRYIMDLHAAVASARRVLRDDGNAVFVIGTSCLRSVFIKSSEILEEVAIFI